jgi:hypothetical protein
VMTGALNRSRHSSAGEGNPSCSWSETTGRFLASKRMGLLMIMHLTVERKSKKSCHEIADGFLIDKIKNYLAIERFEIGHAEFYGDTKFVTLILKKIWVFVSQIRCISSLKLI